jgi:hypothetical protein
MTALLATTAKNFSAIRAAAALAERAGFNGPCPLPALLPAAGRSSTAPLIDPAPGMVECETRIT